MTSDPATKQPAATRQKRLALAAALTLAATAWLALQPDDSVTSASSASSAPSAISVTRDSSAAAPSAPRRRDKLTPLPPPLALSWPDASLLGARLPWRAAAAQGVAAWAGVPPPASAPPPATRAAAPPPAPAPAPAIEPPVPAFPYQLIGQLDDGVPQALLSGPSRSFGARAADVIDGQWRVDSVQARSVTVIWLRTGARKTLSFAPP